MALQQSFFSAPADTVKLYSFEEHAQNKKRFYAGEITSADEIRAIVERIKASESVLKAELNARTLKQLCPGGMPYGYKKADVVDSIYNRLLKAFIPANGFQWSPFTETEEEALTRIYNAVTDESLAEYLAKISAERQELEKAMTNPETLEEFRRFVNRKGEAALTAEQKIRFDELQAEQAQANKAVELARKAEIQAVELEGVTLSMIESFHTKKKIPLWVVQISQRVDREVYNELNRKAKQLGGYYSNFNRAAAGFQFEQKEQAEKFMALGSGESVSRLDRMLEKQEERKDNAADRLRSVAVNLREKAEEILNRDRLVNTARRAGMAASAEADAHADLYMADTLDNLADAIESGEARHLAGVKYKTHVETLHWAARRARDKADRLAGISWEKTKERSATIADIEHAEYPYPNIYKSHLLDACKFLADKAGAMRLAQKMEKRIKAERSDLISFRWESEISDLVELIRKLKENGMRSWDYERLASALEDYKRVKDMGLDTEPELRAALREFLRYRGEGRKADPIKKMERELIGRKIPGYFPTPSDVVDRLLDLADIREGMRVLEPSAGKGNIADAVKEACPSALVQVVEIHTSLQAVLRAKGYTILAYNCLDIQPGSWVWDRVVMNPPFENGQDIEHVKHAYTLLKEGGRLVAIMSEGPFYRSDSQAVGFRSWLESVGGYSERLPEGSFKNSERSTGVNTRIVVINK
jgi:predicted RNA methylase